MKKFRKDKTALAQSLDRLQGFAEGLIGMETNRRIQLGKEKEARMVAAYQSMIKQEETEISEINRAIRAIEDNLLQKGVELQSVKDVNRTDASEEILMAANKGAIEMMRARLKGSNDHRNALEEKRRTAQKIGRHINLFEDALQIADPSRFGDEHAFDAEDVAEAGIEFMEQRGVLYEPEMVQFLEEMQSETRLQGLTKDYYARLAEEANEKVAAANANQTDARINIQTLESSIKETQEAVKYSLQSGPTGTENPMSKLTDQFGVVITREGELLRGVDNWTGLDLEDDDRAEKTGEISEEHNRLAAELFPYAKNLDQGIEGVTGIQMGVKDLQAAIVKAIGNPSKGIAPNYFDLIEYLKEGNQQYESMGAAERTDYQSTLLRILGIDIADKEWIDTLSELNSVASRSQIYQGGEELRIARSILPETALPEGGGDKTDLDLFLREEFS